VKEMRNLAGITIVESVVKDMLIEKDVITSLDVKNELRQMGFEANQKDVSEQLQICADIIGLEFNYKTDVNGKSYKEYKFPDVDVEDDDVVYSYTDDGDLK